MLRVCWPRQPCKYKMTTTCSRFVNNWEQAVRTHLVDKRDFYGCTHGIDGKSYGKLSKFLNLTRSKLRKIATIGPLAIQICYPSFQEVQEIAFPRLKFSNFLWGRMPLDPWFQSPPSYLKYWNCDQLPKQ